MFYYKYISLGFVQECVRYKKVAQLIAQKHNTKALATAMRRAAASADKFSVTSLREVLNMFYNAHYALVQPSRNIYDRDENVEQTRDGKQALAVFNACWDPILDILRNPRHELQLVCAFSSLKAVTVLGDGTVRRLLEGEARKLIFRSANGKTGEASQVSALSLLAALAARGMVCDHSIADFPVRASPLGIRLLRRVLPTLCSATMSKNDDVRIQALVSLGQLSRVRDCRALLLRGSGDGGEDFGIPFLRRLMETMQAAGGNSRAAGELQLTVLHLLWDGDWRAAISEMEPPFESYTVSLLGGAMRELEKEHARLLCASEDAFEDAFDEAGDTPTFLENDPEEVESHHNAVNSALDRCLMVLGQASQFRMFPEERVARLRELARAVVDIESTEGNYHAMQMVRCLAWRYPAAFQVRSPRGSDLRLARGLLRQMVINTMQGFQDHLAGRKEHGMLKMSSMAIAYMCAADEAWIDVFTFAADAPHMFARTQEEFEACAPGAFAMLPSLLDQAIQSRHSTPKTPTDREHVELEMRALTGEMSEMRVLNSCAKCGAVETKRGTYKMCSACNSVHYCSKECQKAHWKGHKAVCKQLRAEKQ